MNQMKVKDVMTHPVLTFKADDKVVSAARRLVSNQISGAPVVEDGRVVGVVSEADLVQAYAPGAFIKNQEPVRDPLAYLLRGTETEKRHARTVGEVMSPNLVSVSPETSVWRAASSMEKHGIRRLVVVDEEGMLVGILTRSDLVRAMARSDDDISRAAKRAITLLGEENFSSLEVDAQDGVVTVTGFADRRTTRDLAIQLVSQVPGVLDVIGLLKYNWDDSEVRPSPNPSEWGKDPWAVGPLVRESF